MPSKSEIIRAWARPFTLTFPPADRTEASMPGQTEHIFVRTGAHPRADLFQLAVPRRRNRRLRCPRHTAAVTSRLGDRR